MNGLLRPVAAAREGAGLLAEKGEGGEEKMAEVMGHCQLEPSLSGKAPTRPE